LIILHFDLSATRYVRTMNRQLERSDKEPSMILCVVDFSEASHRALRWTVKIARCLDTHVTVLYTFRLTQSKNGEALSLKRKKEEEAVIQFRAMENDLLIGKDLSYDFRTEVGFFTDRIEDYIAKNTIQLLVIGKTLPEGNKETFEELIKNLQIPLVIIP
jgi:Universal stress protein family